MKKINILVFPCGSEIGLEVHRSLNFSKHVNIIGANSVDDHGKFIYKKYIGDLPFIDSVNFSKKIKQVIKRNKIDAIYPTMDYVIFRLKEMEKELGCKVISSDLNTTKICSSKLLTYKLLNGKIKIPEIFSINNIKKFPVFLKPDVGYGSRGVCKIDSADKLKSVIFENPDKNYLILEYLPGEEFTVDCFTDRYGNLRFVGPRKRSRIVNGISVNTKMVNDRSKEFNKIANIINNNLQFRGAWFFQLKKDSKGCLTLLEVASRLGGSSSLYRGLGVNFALLSVFDAFNINIDIKLNKYKIELDRALSNKYKTNLNFDNIYVDFDDCLVINKKINLNLISFLFSSFNNKKRVILITKHNGDIKKELKKFRIESLFDEIIHISKDDNKYRFIKNKKSIFIDDSFSERKMVSDKLGIPVFSPDMIEIFN